jgi:hypothetical protein
LPGASRRLPCERPGSRSDHRPPRDEPIGLTARCRPLYSAGFATSLRRASEGPCGGIGRRARLKIEFRKECWFDSGQGHQKLCRMASHLFNFKPPTADMSSRSRGAMRPRFAINLRPENRGRGECRAPDAPAASCAHGVVSMHTSIHSEPSEITRHSRTQWFYGLYRALPGDRLSCHRHLRKPGSSAPGRADLPSANLTPASRRQDHTSSPSASNIVRQHAGRRSRETRPAIPCTPDAAASTATRPNVHDDGQRPSDRDGMAVDIK